jgi:hypothetical protein
MLIKPYTIASYHRLLVITRQKKYQRLLQLAVEKSFMTIHQTIQNQL